MEAQKAKQNKTKFKKMYLHIHLKARSILPDIIKHFSEGFEQRIMEAMIIDINFKWI
jgi:hypothetical protein